jgi:CBS domain-containing protein
MLIKEITHNDIPPLELTDSVSTALLKIDLLHTPKLPVIDEEERITGMASLEKLIEVVDEESLLLDIELEEPVYVPAMQHLFEAARFMLAHELYLLPVLDEEQKYLGIIKKRDVLDALGKIFNLASAGSVITVDLDAIDFSLSNLVRLIELEGAKILGVAVEQPQANNTSYRVSFKLNLEDSSVVSAGLRRFGYTISSEANSEALDTNFSERADELIRYLDI